MNQMAADSGMKNIQALIPNVESGEAASAEEITQCSVVKGKNLRIEDGKQDTHREREREAQIGITLFTKVCNSYK